MPPSLKNRFLAWLDTIYCIVKNGFDLGRAEEEIRQRQYEEIRKAKEMLE